MNEEFNTMTFATQDYLFKEGSRSESAYLILEGKVAVRLGDQGENPRTLAVLERGDVVGEMSLIDNEPHMASAIAIEHTKVSALSASEFNKRVDDMDPLMKGILTILIKRLRAMGKDLKAKEMEVNWGDWNK